MNIFAKTQYMFYQDMDYMLPIGIVGASCDDMPNVHFFRALTTLTFDIDYNDSFDETFGKDYFDPDITLEQAIRKEGLGTDHLASAGTAAYLNALADPEIDEEIVHRAVNFGYIHQIENYLSNCKNIEKKIPVMMFN